MLIKFRSVYFQYRLLRRRNNSPIYLQYDVWGFHCKCETIKNEVDTTEPPDMKYKCLIKRFEVIID